MNAAAKKGTAHIKRGEEQEESPLAFTSTWEALPAVTLGALALGTGGRFLRSIFETAERDPAEMSGKIRPSTVPVSNIPVEVTPQEAAELRRRGVKVRKVLRKKAADPDFFKGIAYGAAGAGAGLLGWELSDWIIDTMRKREAKRRLETSRERLERLMEEKPDEQDIKIAKVIYAAEEQLFKRGQESGGLFGDVSKAVGFGKTLLGLGGIGIGAGTVLAFLASIREAKEQSRSAQRIRALGRFMQQRRTESPYAAMEPVVVETER